MKQLLEYAEGFAIAERAARLQVVVEEDNRRALDFYRSVGATRWTREAESLLAASA